ncbi:phosphoribosyl-dephospho-CoA transferase MdcG domain-containing protein [Sphaerisporangium sp. TRM90804]|uniref:phosphoribosyl-dephospho-CoA transferase MdcG domain-containing protein n=1 Tax=Sphaerisporangium sp. TRM90804 TaxID=3031113 RepID=UPI00244979D3|nr:phosphoribosyl-dephospho-CoA transferase MdcG domain-containing protein [Sphaerisporangium sp. TRM90804]MDH2426105.1 malonate decarboxylase holo-[acyl-carrier-protein] synthase [Sphaerisporangium sp. TRM90804]
MALTARPHDLLRLTAAALDGTPPAWAAEALAACPWGVVRRAPHPPGLIPVGVRGPERRQRHAALVPASEVTRTVPPEALRNRRPRLPHLAATLTAVARLLDGGARWDPTGSTDSELNGDPGRCPTGSVGLRLDGDARWGPTGSTGLELDGGARWGPTGGVGFELAAGWPATHPGSDLDLLIRAPRRLERPRAARLAAAFAALPCRVDCQLETPRGGVGLVEWARPSGPVMVRTDHGPELVDDPWAPA